MKIAMDESEDETDRGEGPPTQNLEDLVSFGECVHGFLRTGSFRTTSFGLGLDRP